MRIFLLSISIIALSSISVFAEVKSFTKEYTYHASELDSKSTSRILALDQVKRLILEEIGVFIISETEVRNSQLTKDQVTSITGGIVSAEVLSEKWDGERYWVRAKVLTDPLEVAIAITKIGQDKQKTKELEDIRKKADAQAKEIVRLKNDLNNTRRSKGSNFSVYDPDKVKLYNSIVTNINASDWVKKGISIGISKAAINSFNKAIELDSENIDAYFQRAIANVELANDFNLAIIDIDKVAQLLKSKTDIGLDNYLSSYSNILTLRAKAYYMLKLYNNSIDDLLLAIKYSILGTPSIRYWNFLEISDLASKSTSEYSSALIMGSIGRRVEKFSKDHIRSDNDDFTSFSDSLKSSAEAIKDYHLALINKPNDLLTTYLLAYSYTSKYVTSQFAVDDYIGSSESNEDIATAMKYYDIVLDKSSDNELLIRCYYAKYIADNETSYEKSLVDLNHILNIDHKSSYIRTLRANTYYKLGKYRAAIEDYTNVIDVDYQDDIISNYSSKQGSDRTRYIGYELKGRGDCYFKLNEYNSALNDYTKSIKLGQHDFDTYRMRSLVYMKMKMTKLSNNDVRESTKYLEYQERKTPRDFYNAANMLANENDPESKLNMIFNLKVAAVLGHKQSQNKLHTMKISWK